MLELHFVDDLFYESKSLKVINGENQIGQRDNTSGFQFPSCRPWEFSANLNALCILNETFLLLLLSSGKSNYFCARHLYSWNVPAREVIKNSFKCCALKV